MVMTAFSIAAHLTGALCRVQGRNLEEYRRKQEVAGTAGLDINTATTVIHDDESGPIFLDR